LAELTLEQEDELLVDFARKRREREEHDAEAVPVSPGASTANEVRRCAIMHAEAMWRTLTCPGNCFFLLRFNYTAGRPLGGVRGRVWPVAHLPAKRAAGTVRPIPSFLDDIPIGANGGASALRERHHSSAAEAAAGDPRGHSGSGYERASGFVRAGEGGTGDDHTGPSLLSEDMARELKRQRWEDEEREGTQRTNAANAATLPPLTGPI